jgi:tRNA (cytidine/uridine-2'-O-)-methyltransferase
VTTAPADSYRNNPFALDSRWLAWLRLSAPSRCRQNAEFRPFRFECDLPNFNRPASGFRAQNESPYSSHPARSARKMQPIKIISYRKHRVIPPRIIFFVTVSAHPMNSDAIHLQPHRLKVVLLHPQIAPNTGNIARSCVATGTELHLVRPMGFVLSDRNLRRSAMDYWDRLKLTVHDDDDALLANIAKEEGRVWLFTSRGKKSIWNAKFTDGDWLIFGSETAGIGEKFLSRYPDRLLRIPQIEGERCLNLATAAGVALYEALRSSGQ